MEKRSFCLVYFILLCSILSMAQFANAEDRINKIYIETHDVFELNDPDWFFASPFLNKLHAITKPFIIQDELLFKENDELDELAFRETERNLLSTGIFKKVSIEIEEVGNGLQDVYVVTKDMWSLYPAPIIGGQGGEYYIGARIKEYNLLGYGLMLDIGANAVVREDRNDIGWEWELELEKRRLFRTEMNLAIANHNTYLRNETSIILEKPFRTLNTDDNYGITAHSLSGNDYFVNRGSLPFRGLDTLPIPEFIAFFDTTRFLHTSEQKVQAWYSRAWNSNDKVYLTALFEYQQADRFNNIFNRAFDNQGKLLFGFSSVSQTFYHTQNVDSYDPTDLAIGGWGNMVLGAIFPSNSRGEKGLFYIAGQIEKSYYKNNFYLFGQFTASSCFSSDFAKYTYQEFLGLMNYKLSNSLAVAARIYEQASWNYPRFRQLILDDLRGVRGYDMQGMAGDNRMVANVELRWFPNFRLVTFNISAVAFYDIGAVWQQRTEDALFKSRFYSSAGLGFRAHFTKSQQSDHILRVDIPYNFAEKKFAISLGVEQYFSAFSSHKFKLPAIYNEEFNYE